MAGKGGLGPCQTPPSPNLLVLQAGLNASCVCVLVTKPAVKRKGSQFLKCHLQRGTRWKQESLVLDAGKDL